jgi:genome maintenance exonuclease 1
MQFNHIPVEIDELKRINTDNGRRYITPSGTHYPSITTILSHKSKPSIDAWRRRVGAKEANKITRIATTRGTSIHKLCENALRNEPEDRETLFRLSILDQEMYGHFWPLLREIDNIRAVEATLYSDHLRLAGQVDCIAEYRGRLSVIDFKTSKKKKEKWMCENMFIQCSAYAIMFEERTGIPVDQTVILMVQEDEGPVVFVEKRDNYVSKLIEARDAYENEA